MIKADFVKVLLAFLLGMAFPTFLFSQAENPANPDWGRYHSTEDAHRLLEGWARAYPNLTRLYSIGETLQGTPLMVLEITNHETGAASDKPAYYYDGNIHAGELTGAEVALHFAWHVLSGYSQDPRIRQLVDTRALYVRPKFNPDGADIAMQAPYPSLRSTPRPYDEDQDGLLDEDPGNDLNGDGYITQMRVPNPNGRWKISREDPRLMVRRAQGEAGGSYYDVLGEGIDDDRDGQLNEDGLGGIDMNRNFPRNWGLEFEQSGAGPYPLSEPETRATLAFINGHRNITGVFHGHTAGGFLYRLPSTTSWDNFNMADQRLILELSNQYAGTTGQPVRASYTNPRVHRHGTLISWSYWDFGVVGFVPEFWGAGQDFDGNGRISDLENLRWNDEQLDGEGFIAWKSFQHPDLGSVEIGGWKRRFVFQNPPPHLLLKEVEQYVPWMLWLAEISPLVRVTDVDRQEMAPGITRLKISIENQGYLPTNITQRALETGVAVPVRVLIETHDAELIGGQERTELGHLPGTRDSDSPTRKSVEYVLRKTGPEATVQITVVSEKGGTSKLDILRLN